MNPTLRQIAVLIDHHATRIKNMQNSHTSASVFDANSLVDVNTIIALCRTYREEAKKDTAEEALRR